ncbi:MAG: hypothetical protein ACREN6_01205 [Gemmatimonadaceae bacterium]
MSALEIATAPLALSPVAERLAHVGRAIEPILNRVVLVGPPAEALLIDNPSVRCPQMSFTADSALQFLSTSMVDRLGVDLQKLGFLRVGRTSGSDRWRHDDGITLDLIQVQTDGDTPHQLSLEYATLLTQSVVDVGAAFRVAAAPALLALECTSFSFTHVPARVLHSEELERVVQLIAGRKEIETECAAAPAELRSIITSSLARLVATDALPLLVMRALPDAALLPALAARVRERIVRMAC